MSQARSNKRYDTTEQSDLSQAYHDGFYDGALSILSESAFKITGICDGEKSIATFLENMSFNGTTPMTEKGQKASQSQPFYTQLWLATPRDDRRNKLSAVVATFLNEHFSDQHYFFTEHTDTDILHYHVLVQRNISPEELTQLRSKFVGLCTQHEMRMI